MSNTCEVKENNIVEITDLQNKKDLEMAKVPSLDYNLRNADVQIFGENIIYVFDKDGKMQYKTIGKKIEIDEIIKNIETLEIRYNLNIYTFDGRIIPIVGIDRKSVNDKSKLLELSAYGSEINSHNSKYYVQSIENQEKFKEISNYHEKIGWGIYEEKKIYKHTKAIGMPYEHTSLYKGQLDISKGGTLKDWEEYIKEEVIGQTPLEGAIAIGVSSVVVGYIGAKIGVTSQLFHIFGGSSTGKTTAGELMIGTATKPGLQNNGLMYSWSATNNAIIGNLRNNFGLPILFDDSSVSRLKDFSSLLYQLVQGRDKDRMTKEGELRESETWRTTIISTGEQSLLSNSNQNEGLRVRTIEIGNVQWTKDAAHSERIKRKASKYYGHAVGVVAKELIELGETQVLELVEKSKEKCKRYLLDNGKYNRLHDRILNTIATVEISITLLEKKLHLGFNIEEIIKFILDQTLMDDRSISDKAYEDILEYVASNSSQFNQIIYNLNSYNEGQGLFTKGSTKEESNYVREKTNSNPNKKTLGKIEDMSIEETINENGKRTITIDREITIPVKILKSIFKELGYTNPTGILKDFKDKGLLSHDIDRNTRKRKLGEGGSTIIVNVIKAREEVILEDEEENITINKLDTNKSVEESDGEIDF